MKGKKRICQSDQTISLTPTKLAGIQARGEATIRYDWQHTLLRSTSTYWIKLANSHYIYISIFSLKFHKTKQTAQQCI